MKATHNNGFQTAIQYLFLINLIILTIQTKNIFQILMRLFIMSRSISSGSTLFAQISGLVCRAERVKIFIGLNSLFAENKYEQILLYIMSRM